MKQVDADQIPLGVKDDPHNAVIEIGRSQWKVGAPGNEFDEVQQQEDNSDDDDNDGDGGDGGDDGEQDEQASSVAASSKA